MDVKVVDNFLDKIDFKKVKKRILGSSWILQRSCNDIGDKDQSDFLMLD